jgi:hypothetical protein
MIKIEPTDNSRYHTYFIKHLVCVTEIPRATRNQKTQVFNPMAMNKKNHLQQLKNGTGRGKKNLGLTAGNLAPRS